MLKKFFEYRCQLGVKIQKISLSEREVYSFEKKTFFLFIKMCYIQRLSPIPIVNRQSWIIVGNKFIITILQYFSLTTIHQLNKQIAKINSKCMNSLQWHQKSDDALIVITKMHMVYQALSYYADEKKRPSYYA